MELKLGIDTKIVYPLRSESLGLVYKEGTLNYFGGLNHCHMQVLKSAAGYYIGWLCEENFGGKIEYIPNERHSQRYWSKREVAEDALISDDYETKF